MSIKTEFVTDFKSGERMIFKPDNTLLVKRVKKQQRTIAKMIMVIGMLVLWCVGLTVKIHLLDKELAYPREVEVVESTAPEPQVEINEDLSSFTLTPVDVPPLKMKK